jgi:signal transduction histidine kinase/ActR/RegA family two-component response regulator
MSRSFIRKQLLLPLSLAFLFVLLAAVGCIYWLQLRHIEQTINTRLTGIEHLIPKLLVKEAEALEVLLDILVEDKKLQQAWLNGDRESLYQQTSPLLENIRSRYGITHFYFMQPDRSCFLRVHHPQAHGDLINRFTMMEAARTGNLVVGAELGKFEAFTLRVVKPWFIDGKLSGYIELGEEIVNLTHVLQRILGVDLVLTLAKPLLDRQEWEKGRELFNSSRNWGDFPSFVVADQTFGQLPPALVDILRYTKNLTDDQRLSFSTDDAREYRGRIAPLYDAGGQRIGQMLVLHEISREVENLNKAIFIIAGLTLAAGGILFFFFNLFAGRIDRTLNRSFNALEHEITERRQTEEELQRYQEQLHELVETRTVELKEINQKAEAERQRAQRLESIGLLAGGIAHDFNNILTAILGNIALAMIYLQPESKATAKLLLAEKASVRARGLAQQLLTFAKGGAPVKKILPVPHLLQEPVLLALRGSTVKGEFQLQENLWPVEVDEGQFSQVISNLVINAVQAMPGGGLLKTAAANEIVDRENSLGLTAGKFVRIAISDQGCGIPKEYLDKIYDPYFTTKETGSGLGLAICYSIIKKHGGTITVDSIPGKGSTFLLYLPAAESKPVSEGAQREAVERGAGRILVMDDDEFVNQVAADLLRYLGYHPETVTGGAEAVAAYSRALAAGEPFDAVITDLTVPGDMGGAETARRLLEIDPTATVIVSSGYANDPIMADYARYGFKGVIPKPYKTAELSRTLQEVLIK